MSSMASKEKNATAGGRNARRRARTRSSLVAAGRRLFARQGFEATTINQIADEADIAVGSFYNYFKTKEDLLTALLEQTLAEQLALLEVRRRAVDDIAERVSIAHRHLVEAVIDDPDWGWLWIRLEAHFTVTTLIFGEEARRDLRSGIESGRFDVRDPEVAIQGSGGALLGVIHALLRGELGPDAAEAHAEGILRGFGVPPGEAAEIARRPLPPSR
jgi:AcrR family transcriptional regulator